MCCCLLWILYWLYVVNYVDNLHIYAFVQIRLLIEVSLNVVYIVSYHWSLFVVVIVAVSDTLKVPEMVIY